MTKVAVVSSVFIFAIILALTGLRACSEFEIRRTDNEFLDGDALNRNEYPWSMHPGVVSKLTKYKEAYDVDSNDWIAHFFLDPREALNLSLKLQPIPEKIQQAFRCMHSIAKGWAPESICTLESMRKIGFNGYFYNPSLCPAGCKQDIVLWLNLSTGEAYIVGAPDHD